jgi:hypothetical protein
MLPDISLVEEALQSALGLKFGKLSLKEFSMTTTHKFPYGDIIRKTTISQVVRDGVVLKHYIKKEVSSVL